MCYKGFLVFSALADLSIQILVQIPLYYNTFRHHISLCYFYHTLIHFASINLFFIVAFYNIIGFLLSLVGSWKIFCKILPLRILYGRGTVAIFRSPMFSDRLSCLDR